MNRIATSIVATAALIGLTPAAGAATFLHISDIHFDPFVPEETAKTLMAVDTANWRALFAAAPDQTFSKYGADTNHALYDSALLAIGMAGVDADFAIVTGDLLSHDFQTNAEKILGLPVGSAANDAFALRTTLYVLQRLRAALPGKPILVSLGNNDSSCGDYKIDPGGAYLAATREIVRSLAGPALVSANFDETWSAGGWFSVRHPTVAGITVIVLDDVLWSEKYDNACGTGGLEAATTMLSWLEAELAAARASDGKVWMMHHIPVGMDPYATAHSKETACAAKVVPLLHEPFASTYVRLLAEYGDVVVSSFTGHTHYDDYRLLRDAAGNVTGTEKIAPAISPVFGQNPGFHVFSYDRGTGALADFRTMWLTNLEDAADPAAGIWREEYAFAATYGQPDFSPTSAEAMWQTLSAERTADETFRKLYNVSKGELSADGIEAWICAIGHADAAGYTACYCGG